MLAVSILKVNVRRHTLKPSTNVIRLVPIDELAPGCSSVIMFGADDLEAYHSTVLVLAPEEDCEGRWELSKLQNA